MEVSPKTLREVEFREKMRGYHPEDVDQFLETVAAGIEVMQDRLRQAVERAQRAEAMATESGAADETLRKTLVLAQRTADMAVAEAREQASRILASAEAQAQSILSEAEERGRRTLEDTIAECRAELSRLETTRSQAQQDVESLQRWLDEHKAHLQESLSEAMAAVERAGVLWPAPSTRPLEGSSRSLESSAAPLSHRPAVPAPPSPLPPEPLVAESDLPAAPEAKAWAPSADERIDVREPAPDYPQVGSGPSRREPPADMLGDEVDQQAMDDFFDDNDEFADDRRFGGRLRRRR